VELYAALSLALVAGVISFTSPCTLPLLPGYVSYISGVPTPPETGSSLAVAATRRRVLGAALLFILGFTLVFTALGATSSALGFLLVRHLRALQLAGGLLIITMGLITTGLLTVPPLARQRRVNLTRVRRGPAGAVVLGASFAFGWTPCVGPVLATILTTAASTATVPKGALLLATYSLGLGLPFLLVAAGIARGQQRLGWLRRHTRAVELCGGVLLVAMGVAMLTGGWTALMSRMLAAYAQLGWPPV
jgi:cytochrome c-type biogenesis protein